MKEQASFGLFATALLHILPAGVWWWSSVRAEPVQPATPSPRTIEVRLHAASASPARAEVATPGADSAPASAPAPAAVQASPGAIAPVEAPAGAPAGPMPVAEAPYTPARELDSRPEPEAPVVVPFPDAPVVKAKVSAVLVLYIDVDGSVNRIEVERSDLPPQFEQTAVDTFKAARMRPGTKAGRPARARMKVLVEFEAT